MNILHFNIAILLGWLLVSAGALLVSVGYGLVASGSLLIVLTFALSRIAGLYAAKDGA